MSEKLEPCIICRIMIDLDKENYLKLQRFKQGKEKDKGYYHEKCFRERVMHNVKSEKMQDMAQNLALKANKLLEKVGFA
ncbi:hypothetical protein LCGC14_0949580 [marine sediment metagenome]|uniref:PARP-type domain-containing protein n=1 Tax=marine sediment metagenome TaxID=412755 RepID=A0A0F9RP39_9ZZZZ|nr:hypothetical protein [Candidatus Pacearchaeota archaeon]